MNPDDLDIRCPRLGSSVDFGYCRTCGDSRSPCFKIFDCWWERFDVTAYFRERLSDEEFAKMAGARPESKISSLVELIELARRNAADGGAD